MLPPACLVQRSQLRRMRKRLHQTSSVISAGCRPSSMASTIFGASGISRSTRLTWDALIFFPAARVPYAINLARNYAPGAYRPSRSGPCGDVRYYYVGMCLPSACRTMAHRSDTLRRRPEKTTGRPPHAGLFQGPITHLQNFPRIGVVATQFTQTFLSERRASSTN